MSIVKCGAAVLIAISLLPSCASGRSNESLESRVSKLVDQMTKSERVGKMAFGELESLGNQAVPYLVSHLDDMRPLAEKKISLTNKASGAFEGARQYSPNTVHDALAAILNQITGQNFVFVYNGATPRERDENRRKWIEWCQSTYPDQAEVCSGK